MFRKNLTVVFKPSKNNAVQLPESYLRSIQTYENGSLCLNYLHNKRNHYIAWSPYAGNLRDAEIGINSNVAKAIGLKEGAIVTCTLIPDVAVVSSISVATNSQKDWDMLEVSSYRIQSTLLDQTRVVNNGQSLVIWINPVMHLVVNVDSMSPNVPYGKLTNNTEVRVAPYKSYSTKLDELEPLTTQQILDRLPQRSSSAANIHSTNGVLRPLTNGHTKDPSKRLSSVLESSYASPYSALAESKNTKNSMNFLIEDLQKHAAQHHVFRVISTKWDDTEMADVYLTRHNLPASLDVHHVFRLQTSENREYYVNVKVMSDKEIFPKNIYPTLELNDVLINKLALKPFERVTLRRQSASVNNIERIELHVSRAKDLSNVRDMERMFKQRIIDVSTTGPFLINQSQVFRLESDVFLTATIYPDSLRFGSVDAAGLRSCRIVCADKVREIVKANTSDCVKLNTIQPSSSFVHLNGQASGHEYVELDKFQTIVDQVVEHCKIALCLDDRYSCRSPGNVIVAGKSKSGKSSVGKRILEELAAKPFYCHSEVFYCAKNKGRKPESIQKDLRQVLNTCLTHSPSVLVLDNLDILTQNVAEQTQDGEYYNRVSDVIQHLILEYTETGGILVLATVTNKSNLNKRVYTSRGRHLFHLAQTIPDLEKTDREKIICDLCLPLKSNTSINFKKFASLTEGYSVGDLVEFVQRSIFYAHRSDSVKPVLTADHLMESLKITNAYCLQGIEQNGATGNASVENGSADDGDDDDDNDIGGQADKSKQIAGLESVVTVLEEVLIWPAKYPTIFERSPLRNQAGVLLFGAPGTGKTYLVGRLAKLWQLRLISVKGPELLAKYIGQSEENVRNLFDRAKSARPCVLFFDEFDSLAPKRGHDSTGVTDRVVNQLLTELDGVEGLQGVIVIAATSRPELLDGALLRSGRIDRLVECPLPNRNARLAIFQTLAKTLHLADDVDLAFFADRTENFTGADIQSIMTSANMSAVKQCIDEDNENVPDTIAIHQAHLMDAFENTRPSLTLPDIEKYKHMYARFTNKGEKPSRDFVAKRATLA